jgi:large subunit ribosomal protein L18
MLSTKEKFNKRKQRSRNKVKSQNRLRIAINKTSKYIYCQAIDKNANIIATSSSLAMKTNLSSTSNKQAAAEVGRDIAQKITAKGYKDTVMDRGGYKYHGKIAALADAAREKGLNF